VNLRDRWGILEVTPSEDASRFQRTVGKRRADNARGKRAERVL
jgi:hypothetical protein